MPQFSRISLNPVLLLFCSLFHLYVAFDIATDRFILEWSFLGLSYQLPFGESRSFSKPNTAPTQCLFLF